MKQWKITLTNKDGKTFTYDSVLEGRDIAIAAATARAVDHFQEKTYITAIKVEKLINEEFKPMKFETLVRYFSDRN